MKLWLWARHALLFLSMLLAFQTSFSRNIFNLQSAASSFDRFEAGGVDIVLRSMDRAVQAGGVGWGDYLLQNSGEDDAGETLRPYFSSFGLQGLLFSASARRQGGDVATVVSKAIKQRQDSVEQFRAGGREDLAVKEQAEIDLFRKYMPKQLDEAEIEALAAMAIAESGATGKADLGKVMKVLMPQVKGKADGKLVNTVVGRMRPHRLFLSLRPLVSAFLGISMWIYYACPHVSVSLDRCYGGRAR